MTHGKRDGPRQSPRAAASPARAREEDLLENPARAKTKPSPRVPTGDIGSTFPLRNPRASPVRDLASLERVRKRQSPSLFLDGDIPDGLHRKKNPSQRASLAREKASLARAKKKSLHQNLGALPLGVRTMGGTVDGAGRHLNQRASLARERTVDLESLAREKNQSLSLGARLLGAMMDGTVDGTVNGLVDGDGRHLSQSPVASLARVDGTKIAYFTRVSSHFLREFEQY